MIYTLQSFFFCIYFPIQFYTTAHEKGGHRSTSLTQRDITYLKMDSSISLTHFYCARAIFRGIFYSKFTTGFSNPMLHTHRLMA